MKATLTSGHGSFFSATVPAAIIACGLGLGSVGFAQQSGAPVIDAAFSSEIKVDGNIADWAGLSSGTVVMDTKGRGTNGTLAVDIQYAWNYTNLYVLVKENTNYAKALISAEAPDATAYQNTFYLFDTIAFWLDLDNNAGTPNGSGGVVVENNADFQPWFGFSSSGRTDLIYARQNDSGTMNLDGLANVQVATSGTFAQHNRTIEVAMKWADIATSVDTARQPGGDITKAIQPGFTFGSEPLLILVDYNGQAFIGPDQYSPGNGVDANSRDIRLVSTAKVVDAAFAAGITIDGNTNDWASLPSHVVTMNTQGRGTNGTLEVDIQYAWNYTNLYVLVKEDTNRFTATRAQEGTDATAYQNTFYLFDTIAFWLDLDNNAGTPNGSGGVVVENNADFQPWFGFSSSGRTDLIYARQNDSGTMNLDGLANVQVATSGTFAQHNRTIEVAMKWADIATSVDTARQPGGDITKAIQPGFTFGSEPLLILVDYNGQAFIGPDQYSPGNGVDANSRDIRLVSTAKVVDAAFAAGITIDGNTNDWASLPSHVVTMNTQGRGTNGTLEVDIQYAWNYTNLYVLVKEDTNRFTATRAQEGTDATAYQNTFYLFDTIAFWLDLDNNAGTPNGSGGVVVENNADFQPWFGFSSSGRTDLIYARQNDSGTMNLDGLANVQVATSGTFAQHNRTIEVAMKWADIATSVDTARQPGGDITKAIQPGFTFGSEPLLILVDYNGQAFIGPDQYSPGNGVDANSRDIHLLDNVSVPNVSLDFTNWSGTAPNALVLEWPGSATGFEVETSSRLGVGSTWSQVGAPFLDKDGLNKSIFPGASGSAAFYRLRK